eukprot:1148683-Pelagomonas_calceolata.AAC.5
MECKHMHLGTPYEEQSMQYIITDRLSIILAGLHALADATQPHGHSQTPLSTHWNCKNALNMNSCLSWQVNPSLQECAFTHAKLSLCLRTSISCRRSPLQNTFMLMQHMLSLQVTLTHKHDGRVKKQGLTCHCPLVEAIKGRSSA